jgi:hypothetical protein
MGAQDRSARDSWTEEMAGASSSGPLASGSVAPARSRLIRRRIGIVLLGLCFAIPGWFIVSGPRVWNLRLEPGLSWTWELPGSHPYIVLLLYPGAVLAFLPEVLDPFRRNRAFRALLVMVGGALLCLAGMMSAGVVIRFASKGLQIVQLEDPGVYERAVIQASGHHEGLYVSLWLVPGGSDEFELIDAGCWGDWPFEVRQSPHGPRYLIVDAHLRAGTFMDLSTDPPIVRDKPDIEELRSEFGEDITAIATRDG